MGLALFMMASDYLEAGLLSRMEAEQTISEAEVAANDHRQVMVGALFLLVFLSTMVLFFMWIHRVHRNLGALGARSLRFSPGWAVGWFFVPVINLFRPHQVVKEIWEESDPQRGTGSALIGWWWIFWVLSALTSNRATSMYLFAEDTDRLLAASWMAMASDAVEAISSAFTIVLVRSIDTRQEATSRRPTIGGPYLR